MTNVRFHRPNQQRLTRGASFAQEALIRQVYEEARIDPSLTAFVEAHGTGTKVGFGIAIPLVRPSWLRPLLIITDRMTSPAASASSKDPNGEAQEALIRQVYEEARIDPSLTAFVEAHGTGNLWSVHPG
jgi:acyl transferase domain-containing protein